MINSIKKLNKYLLYALVGVAATFAMLGDMLSVTSTTAYSAGSSYAVLLVFVMIFSIVIFAFLPKLVVYLAYRIDNSIFLRKSGMLYPFPIPYDAFESTIYAFCLPCFLLCGVIMIPGLFFPNFSPILSAIRSLVFWVFLALMVRRFLKDFSHDYDKKTLAFSLILIPAIIIGFSFGLTLVEVIR